MNLNVTGPERGPSTTVHHFTQQLPEIKEPSLRVPERRRHLSPSCGVQGGQQLLVLTEHQRVPEAGVGQSGAGPADAEQVVAQNHRSSGRHGGTLRERLVYGRERDGEVTGHGRRRINTKDGNESHLLL